MKPINNVSSADLKEFDTNPHPDIYQRIAIQNAFYPGRKSVFGLAYCGLKLNGEAGELAEHIGKSWRDDDCLSIKLDGYAKGTVEKPYYIVYTKPLTEERRELLIKELGDCLWYIAAICTELGVSMYWVMATNLLKIKNRFDAGTQRGSGDKR